MKKMSVIKQINTKRVLKVKKHIYLFLGILIIFSFYNCKNQTQKDSDTDKDSDTVKIVVLDTVTKEIENNSEIFNCDYLGEKPPKEEPVKFAPEIFSAGCFEISTTGNEIQFTQSEDIYLMSKTDTGWTKPYIAPFCSKYVDGESSFSPDGKKIYFMSNRPLANAKSLFSTFVSEKVNGIWEKPSNLKLPSFNKTIHAVTVAKSGNIYFCGLHKIACNNEEYRIIEKLKPDIIGFHAFIAPDESYLIFDRNFDRNSDLYIIYSKTDSTWTEPIKLNDRINTPSQEGSAYVTPDGKYMFFSRKSDLYWVDASFIEEIRQEL